MAGRVGKGGMQKRHCWIDRRGLGGSNERERESLQGRIKGAKGAGEGGA